MKINITIDCTPSEARAFLGLPDVIPLQAVIMEALEAKLAEAVRTMTPEDMIRLWMPAAMEGWGTMQKAFWSHMNTQDSAQNL